MNEKEISEIRRRFRAEKTNISRICGCYVNEQREIVAQFNQSLSVLSEDETEKMLAILKKGLSGQIGKNLIDIEFTTQQVVNSPEHKLLMDLRSSCLEDEEATNTFYQQVISSVNIQGSYLILLACDKYDVFTYSQNDERDEESANVFHYIVCSVCPVKMTKPALSYVSYENQFHNLAASPIVGAPELGFMFPAFDDRTANIYNALYYTKDTKKNSDEFVNLLFCSQLPLPAQVQKETFCSILSDTVNDSHGFEVVQSVHEQLSTMIDEHKTSKEPEPLKLSKKQVTTMLHSCGVPKEKIEEFDRGYDTEFGQNTKLCPQNIVDVKQFELRTPDVTIKVNPDKSDLVSTQIINGTKYICIRADEHMQVNGVDIQI